MSNVFRIYPPAVTQNYIKRELVTANFANLLLVITIFFCTYDCFKPVAIWGDGNYFFDLVIYSFVAGFLLSYLPSLIAESDLKKNVVAPLNYYRAKFPRQRIWRSLTLASLSSFTVAVSVAVLFTLVPVRSLPWWLAASIKLLALGILGFVVIRIALKESLAAAG